jgi:hypothetical protein
VATLIQLPKAKVKTEKTFGSLDMWNIRRGFKSTGDIMKRH